MDDPWDVKSVRQSGQYVSCMKINGVPLLPPVLSKDCRKEMQYYKLLAKEVEKRIAHLKPLVDEKAIEEIHGDAVELNDNLDLPTKLTQGHVDMTLEIAVTPRKLESSVSKIPTPNIAKHTLLSPSASSVSSPRLIIDLNLDLNNTNQNSEDPKVSTPVLSAVPIEIPEHDYDCEKPTEKDQTDHSDKNKSLLEPSLDYKQNSNDKTNLQNLDLPYFHEEQPSSLTAKSFTGSLNNLHSDTKDIESEPKLLRQSSYTILTPSPQLLAHLQIQSINTGVEMTSISMSESLSNVASPNKKRRSWDLESAKVKWSSMALELKQHNAKRNHTRTSATTNTVTANQNSSSKTSRKMSPLRKSLYEEKTRHASLTRSTTVGSDYKNKRPLSPVKHNKSSLHFCKEQLTELSKDVINKANSCELDKSTPHSPETEDPATRLRELYEKVQKQQSVQMAALVEKQKREQQLLQQAFEEQNNLLFKQLKTICPKPQIEVKQAWEDIEANSMDRGPVSLKQLITDKSSDTSINSRLSTSTLIDTNKYIVQCEQILKKSKDLTSSIKKGEVSTGEESSGGDRTRTHSPVARKNTPASRKLNYDSSMSSDKEYETIHTDGTNDTFADLNVTFPSDCSDELLHNNTVINQMDPCSDKTIEYAIRNMEQKIMNSLSDMGSRPRSYTLKKAPTQVERAAASKLVACARGFLVRRLMRTERVQTTVQTIKDALLCALQLHQEREGIRGADVDLHRRLIQQITAACYSLHDTFINSSAAERCAMIAADRNRRSLAALRPSPKPQRSTDTMSQSHLGVFVHRATRPASSAMTQSNYEAFSSKRNGGRYIPAPNRRPWR